MLNLKLVDFINIMTDKRKSAILAIYQDYKSLFHYAYGSTSNHQAWQGGYADHIAETLRVNKSIYHALSSDIRALPFTEDSALICLFLHDIEKPFRYGPSDDSECNKWRNLAGGDWQVWEKLKWDIISEMKVKYGFELSDDEVNALKYTHGEGGDYQKGKRVAGPLAAHVHHCDNASARIYFNDGKGLG